MNFNGFKAYDVRGKIGEEITDELVYNVGKALGVYLKAKTIVLGSDIRLTSDHFKGLLAKGLQEQGVDVLDLGTSGTEEVYFATSYLGLDGGVEVTASHNPKDYNGLKIVAKNSVPIGIDTGLLDIKELIVKGDYPVVEKPGSYKLIDLKDEYTNKLLSFIDFNSFKNKKLKIVFNIGNGTAGATAKILIDKIQKEAPGIEAVFVHFEPDGNFPNGIPNPLLVDNRQDTINAVKEHKADLGVAFDGDFDRCFFFDAAGEFIAGYYIVGLLAKAFLLKDSSSKIVYEPRLVWNTQKVVAELGGEAVMTKSGHSFIKHKLREIDAVYGGELSAHHYFKDYYYCDSGHIPWLLIAELLVNSDQTLEEMVAGMKADFPVIEETNFTVADSAAVFARIKDYFKSSDAVVNSVDGISYEFKDWRFNVRASNTEPYVRLNLEVRGDPSLIEPNLKLLSSLIY